MKTSISWEKYIQIKSTCKKQGRTHLLDSIKKQQFWLTKKWGFLLYGFAWCVHNVIRHLYKLISPAWSRSEDEQRAHSKWSAISWLLANVILVDLDYKDVYKRYLKSVWTLMSRKSLLTTATNGALLSTIYCVKGNDIFRITKRRTNE